MRALSNLRRFIRLLPTVSLCIVLAWPNVLSAQLLASDPTMLASTPKSDVFMQGFYWNSTPGGIWWDSLARLAPRLAAAGFGAIWFPPPEKGASGSFSMGYDPYDHYDFGQYNQKGTIETRFGSRQELVHAINAYHAVGLQVFADAVMGHMNGAEQFIPYECEPYPSYPDSGWLLFGYPTGSGRFRKNASHFYPNLQTCDVDPPYHGPSDPIFRFGEVLAHAQSHVRDSLIVWGKYLHEGLGFDGFRIDAVKHIDPVFVGPWIDSVNASYAVAEYYGSVPEIGTWLHYCQNVFGGDVSMLDFPLRFTLQDMCNNTAGTFDMNVLDGAGLINAGINGFDVATFVENHDLDRIGWDGTIDNGHNPIITDKDMAYAYIIFSEGRPSVFFKDYFGYGLAGKIDTLIRVREKFLYGGTTKRSALNPWYVGSMLSQDEQSRDIYVARRDGGDGRPQAFLVLNDNATEWRGVWVNTSHPNAVFHDYSGVAIDKQAAADGRVDVWAPPRGYAIYIPDTAAINNAPYIQPIPDQLAFVNTLFEYQAATGDPNNDPIAVTLLQHPAWLSVSPTGLLSGAPAAGDTGTSTVILRVTDPRDEEMRDTFQVSVRAYPIMDGVFEGTSIWGAPIAIADTLLGWDSARVNELYVTSDQSYIYLGASVRARQSMNWTFLLNTTSGGGSTESWLRSIQYIHTNKPDYILRGTFSSYAEFHTWNGSSWSGVGSSLPAVHFAERIDSDTPTDGWVEGRIPKSVLGYPSVIQVQFYLTGNLNGNATYDACPDDQNTTVPTGMTTQLRYYARWGMKGLTFCNLQFPETATITSGDSLVVYARAFGIGVTDSTGQGTGVEAWIGFSTSVTHPSTWEHWIPAVYNVDASGYDEYKAVLGPGLAGATYSYASRFQYQGGEYLYGGYSAIGGGLWNGTTNTSGVLTVQAAPALPLLAVPGYADSGVSTIPVLIWNASPSATSYHIQLSTDSMFAAIVCEDTAFEGTSLSPGLLLTSTRYYWRVRSRNSFGSSPFSVPWWFTTSEYVTNFYPVSNAWNLVSLPVTASDQSRLTLFPTAISNAFAFVPGSGYVEQETLNVGEGYWLKFDSSQPIPLSGLVVREDTIDLQPGWNLIGAIGFALNADSVIQDPPGILESQFYGYSGSYVVFRTLEPARAYWVKSRNSGRIILRVPQMYGADKTQLDTGRE